jgi:hypothetical protein
LELSCGGGGAQDNAGPAIGDDGLEAIAHAVAMRRGRWHCYATGVQAAPKSRDEVQARRIDQQHALSCKAHVLQATRDGPGSSIQLGVREAGVIGWVVVEMHERGPIRALVSVAAQRADQISWNLVWTNAVWGANRHRRRFSIRLWPTTIVGL